MHARKMQSESVTTTQQIFHKLSEQISWRLENYEQILAIKKRWSRDSISSNNIIEHAFSSTGKNRL